MPPIHLRAGIVAVCAVILFPLSALPADEPAAVARQFYELGVGGELEAIKGLVVDGAEVPRMWAWTAMQRNRCVSLAGLRFSDVRVTGDHAEVRATAALVKSESPGGKEVLDVEHPVFTMKRTGDRWKIESCVFEEEKLADDLLKAASDAEADAILAASPELFDEALVRTFRVRGTNFVNRQEMASAERIASSFRRLARLTNDDLVLANAGGLESMLANIYDPPRVETGIHSAEEALAAARRTGLPDTQGQALYNLSRAYQYRDGNTSGGAPLLEEALSLRDRYLDPSLAERSALLLCAYYLERGEYRTCFPYLAIAKEIAIRQDDTLGLYSVEGTLGNLFLAENDCALALPHYERARDIADSVKFIGYIATQRGVAHCAMILGLDKVFRAAADDLLARKDTIDHASLSALWTDIAADALRRGALDEADKAGNEAMRLTDRSFEDTAWGDTSEMVARIRLAQKRYDEALEAAERAIGYRTKSGSVGQLSAWVLAARAHLGRGERDAAYASLRAALQYGETERATAGGTERQVALLFEPAAEAYSMLVDLLVHDGKTREAFVIAERAKGRTLLDILDVTRSSAEADTPPAMVEEERKREKQLVEANTKGDDAAISKARLELETHRSFVDANRPRLHASRGAGNLESIESLQPLLRDEHSAIIEYVVAEDRLHIFIVRRGEKEPRVDVRTVPIKRDRLERLVKNYAAAVSSHDLAYSKDARRLHELLLAPVLRLAPQVRDLAIIPDGALWRLPIESLVDGEGKFAIETRSFFYAPSAVVLLREQTHKSASNTDARLFLGFGDPHLDLPKGELIPGERSTSTVPIPEAAREVETIARIVGARSSSVFTGAEALESRAKAEAPNFRIVHLATHGVIDDANPMYSRLLLSRREGDGEDGVLEAREMLDLHLRADLVVLSACDTARGNLHAGEGLIGMSWALFAAGTPSVIASQWRVGSARTETLMTTFYDSWMKRSQQPFAKARALRAARLALLRDPEYRHPYYWSPFILIGSAN